MPRPMRRRSTPLGNNNTLLSLAKMAAASLSLVLTLRGELFSSSFLMKVYDE